MASQIGNLQAGSRRNGNRPEVPENGRDIARDVEHPCQNGTNGAWKRGLERGWDVEHKAFLKNHLGKAVSVWHTACIRKRQSGARWAGMEPGAIRAEQGRRGCPVPWLVSAGLWRG